MLEVIKKKYNDRMVKELTTIRDTLSLLLESDDHSDILEDCATDILSDVHKSFKNMIDSDKIIDAMDEDSLQDKTTNLIKKGLDNYLILQINELNKEIHKLS